MNKTQVSYYQKFGNLKIKDLFNRRETELTLKGYKDFLKDKKKFNYKNYGKLYSYLKDKNKPTSLHGLMKYKNFIFYKLAKSKKLQTLANKLTDKKTKLYGIQFFIKNKDANLPTSPHQDNAYWCFKKSAGLSFWISLQNTNKNNGCMYYYEKSHLLDYKHFKNEHVPGSTFRCAAPKKLKKKYYTLKTGDCVVHDSRTIHGSFNNISQKNRIAFIVSFIPKTAKKDPLMLKKYKKNFKKVKEINYKKFNQ